MPDTHVLLRWPTRLLFLCCLLWLGLGSALARAEPLRLTAATPTVQAWPAVTLLADPTGALTIDDALAQRERFQPPPSAHATLGVRQEAMWLRIPVALSADAEPRWVFDIDYSALHRVDVHVVVQGRVTQHARLGSELPYSQRPLASRSHAASVTLPPGGSAELLLRVQTHGAMVLPMTFNTPRAYHAGALGEQTLQGLLAGLGLALIAYSLGRYLTLRETLSLKYALLVGSSVLFSLFQFGIGAQYLWRDVAWIEQHAGGFFALTALCGSFLFIAHALTRQVGLRSTADRLAGPYTGPGFSRLMHGGAAVCAAIAVAYLTGLLDIRVVTAVVSVLGPVPALLGLPGALARARRGDSVGLTFLLAWAVYAVTTATLIGVIQGVLPVNFWTLHSFQFGATLDMLLYLRVLGLSTQAVHTAAQHATREREVFRFLAHSDPLTGLHNRRALQAHIRTALQRRAPQEMVALYLMDLDGFKPVNDRHGHEVGDQLLVLLARRLQATVRTQDTVARLGGDEFVVVARGLTDAAQAEALAHKLLETVREPFQVGAAQCTLGLSLGYTLAPHDGVDAAGLLRQADAAMYAGKQAGKGVARRWVAP